VTTLHFAVLAHAHEPLVLNLVRSLAETYPTSSVTVFNGGRDADFLRGSGVTVNPHSSPVRYGNMMPFHVGTLRWLVETAPDYDFLVTLDHDVMVLKGGFDRYLAERLGPDGFGAARLRPAPLDEEWTLGGTTMPYLRRHWQRQWEPLLGLPDPWWGFNPVQAFARRVVEAMWAHPERAAIVDRAVRSHIWAIEEAVMASWALATGATPVPLAGEEAIAWRNIAVADLARHLATPDTCFVHRVPMVADAPERIAVELLRSGGALPGVALGATPEPAPHLAPRWSPARWRHAGTRRYTHLMAQHRG
jgi:hypothetical protein